MARVLALLAQCPYCSAKLRKAPTRSHRCPKCKEQFHIWNSPEGEIFVVTEDELNKPEGRPIFEQNNALPPNQNRPAPMLSKDEMFPFGVRRKLPVDPGRPPSAINPGDMTLPNKSDLHLFQDSKPSLPEEMLEQLQADICPDCKLPITEEMNFCPRCGCKHELENEPACRGCRLPITPEMAFCPRCGTNMENQ